MSRGKSLHPTKYAQKRYNLNAPIDFDVAVNYGGALMAIAGADGELTEREFQWYIDEQEILFVEYEEYIEALRKFDWQNADIGELLRGIKYDFPMNFRRVMLYQAIKMSRADGDYQGQEKIAVARASELLGLENSMLIKLESLAKKEEESEQLRLTLFEIDV
ncbi:hypothetical protein [Okeania sp.]|uniref:hypothetical protein n=1 Tax=Okeania sp. TaxID=3100323 RepID=UPI002B4AE937|nr:hypothetical protein [Okeania sp.]MEB3343498.1 hypothetical protein [Okeania sp.]